MEGVQILMSNEVWDSHADSVEDARRKIEVIFGGFLKQHGFATETESVGAKRRSYQSWVYSNSDFHIRFEFDRGYLAIAFGQSKETEWVPAYNFLCFVREGWDVARYLGPTAHRNLCEDMCVYYNDLKKFIGSENWKTQLEEKIKSNK